MRSSRSGIHEPEHRQHFQAVARVEIAAAGERRAVDRVEEVDRDRLHAQVAERERHVDDVLPPLAHADDAAGAHFHAGVADGAERGEAVVERVRRADFAVERFARVEVVIHAVDAAGLELAGLVGREQAEAGADLEVDTAA